MPFPQMVLWYHCAFAVHFFSWLHFIFFCFIQCSGLLAFCLLFLPFTIFVFLLSIIICKCDEHEFHIFNHVVQQATVCTAPLEISLGWESPISQYVMATFLVIDPPECPTLWFTFLSLDYKDFTGDFVKFLSITASLYL